MKRSILDELSEWLANEDEEEEKGRGGIPMLNFLSQRLTLSFNSSGWKYSMTDTTYKHKV